MAKTNAITYPKDPIGSYEENGLKYLVFELKAKCPTIEDCGRDHTEWSRSMSEAVDKAMLEARSMFPPVEHRFRFATAIDLLERNALFRWALGNGKLVWLPNAFGQNTFLFSVEEGKQPELQPGFCPPLCGMYLRSEPQQWNHALSLDIELLCTLTDPGEETRLYGSGRSQSAGGLEQLFRAGTLV